LLLSSHVPAPHSAVQVVIPVVPIVFFGVSIAHPPKTVGPRKSTLKRLVVSDVQVYRDRMMVPSSSGGSAPSMIVHGVQTFESSHVHQEQAAVQVVIPILSRYLPMLSSTVFFAVAVAHPPVAKRVVVADVQVYVGPALKLNVASAPSMAVQAVQTLLLSHVPAPHAAVQVDIPVVPTVFFGVAVAHPPVAKRVVVSDMQVYVTSLAAAPVMGVHAVQSVPGSVAPNEPAVHAAQTLSVVAVPS